MSPRPGISTLITSAPIHANSCVPVGPAWTWLRSRIRTPSSALLINSSPLNAPRLPSGLQPPQPRTALLSQCQLAIAVCRHRLAAVAEGGVAAAVAHDPADLLAFDIAVDAGHP